MKKLKRSENIAVTKKVLRYIEDNDITEYDVLCNTFMEDEDNETLCECIIRNSLFFSEFLKSRLRKKNGDNARGEVLP